MHILLRIRAFGIAVVVLLALAAAALGFAHRAPSAAAETARVLALSGDICGGMPDAAHSGDCPVCHLVGAVPMPFRGAEFRMAVRDVPSRRPQYTAPAARAVRDPALGLRAPPVA